MNYAGNSVRLSPHEPVKVQRSSCCATWRGRSADSRSISIWEIVAFAEDFPGRVRLRRTQINSATKCSLMDAIAKLAGVGSTESHPTGFWLRLRRVALYQR